MMSRSAWHTINTQRSVAGEGEVGRRPARRPSLASQPVKCHICIVAACRLCFVVCIKNLVVPLLACSATGSSQCVPDCLFAVIMLPI
jgi:hypothetical protein